VLSRGIVLTGAGVAIGAVLAWFVTRAMGTLLYGVSATDPLTFALVASVLAAVSAVASAIPAARGSRRPDARLARAVSGRRFRHIPKWRPEFPDEVG
jgi:hypothetical protein